MRLAIWTLLVGCPGPDDSDTSRAWTCQLSDEDAPFAHELGCDADFAALAAAPLDASIPGARSAKTVRDRIDRDTLYFQDSVAYEIHWEFASAHLSGDGLPIVADLGTFNATEYTSPDRRFMLGALTHYEQPDLWAWEIAPYDSASAELVAETFRQIRDATWVGDRLRFHPTSEAVARMAEGLPDDVPLVTTEEIYDGVDYQPLNLGTTVARLAFHRAADVDGSLVDYRELVVLDEIPGDISVVAGLITEEFQTPLSHLNVLSQNRGTPNMALRGAWDDERLRALEGRWVSLTVGAHEWDIHEVTQDEADAWWEEHRPDPIDVGEMDLSVVALTDAADLLDLENLPLSQALREAVPAFGGKASHYGGLVHIPEVPAPTAFAIPLFYYHQHLTENGLWDDVDAMLADPSFQADPDVRASRLAELRTAIEAAPLNAAFYDAVLDKLDTDFPGVRMRFRSSTNAEDLGAFTGAGLYTSKTGDPNDPDKPVDRAIKQVWASVWGQRAYEEREYWGIDHTQVGMALLSHRSYPDEDANGVAITANLFDPSGLEPAFYVNVQVGEESVVQPEPGVTSDQLLYYYNLPNQPIVYIARSNLVEVGQTVLDAEQIHELGVALDAIHRYFAPAYGSLPFYAMDTEFKFERDDAGVSRLHLKQARPYPGRGGLGSR
jgi:pyruvate,water dikinase